MEVLNHDIVGLHARINRYIEEVFLSVSSSSSLFNAFDQSRVMTYLTSIDTYREWMVAQPQLDLPESHPHPWILEDNPVIASVENESINDLIRMWELFREEVINSQSARQGAGLNEFDNLRAIALIEKSRLFMTDYVAEITPLDLPESSPQEPLSGSGKKGI